MGFTSFKVNLMDQFSVILKPGYYRKKYGSNNRFSKRGYEYHLYKYL